MTGVLVSLEDLERAGRWTPAPEPPRAPVPLTWHGDVPPIHGARALVKGMLPEIGVALLGGQSGAGKTFLALDLAGALAEAAPWFGGRIRQPAGAIYLAGEAAASLPRRLETMRRHRGLEEPLPIAWRPVADLAKPERMAALTEDLRAAAGEMMDRHGLPLRLVIVDTVAAAFGFKDENSASEIQNAMTALGNLSADIGALVLATAHYGKNLENGIRGSSAFIGGADAVIAAMAEFEGKKVVRRVLQGIKFRDDETGWERGFDLCRDVIGQDEDGDDVTSCHVEPIEGDEIVRPTKGRRLSDAEKVYLEAFDEALAAFNHRIQPDPDMRFINAVDAERVREEFMRRYPAEGDTEKAKGDSRRQGLKRARSGMVKADLLCFRTIEGKEWVWRP